MWCIIQLVQIVANLCIEKLKLFTKKYILISIISLLMISLTMFGLSKTYGNYIGILSFAIFIFFNYIQGPILGTYTAELFEEKDRATCFSVMSLIGSVISAFGLAVGGYIGDTYSLINVYKFAGIAIFIVFILHSCFSLLISLKNGALKNEI